MSADFYPWVRCPADQKYTIKAVENMDTTPVANLVYGANADPTVVKAYEQLTDNVRMRLFSSKAAARLGQPDINMQGYEYTPGAWVFRHVLLPVTLVIFSDGHRKHHRRGTSYEVACDHQLNSDALIQLINDLCVFAPAIQDDAELGLH